MRPPSSHFRRAIAVAMAIACAFAGGCAGLPRIDPTGQRCLIWPTNQVATPPGAFPATMAPPVVGNPVAPPVVTDPFFPQVPAPQIAAPAAAPATTIVTPASVAYPQVVQDRLFITPGRVLAPVGSEVVLKASICTPDGYTLANQKVEWMLGRNGVGQFVELGGKGILHPPLVPWNRGRKIDNYLAQGYTADGPLCIDRGTPDPTDDVNINRGDAWISVTSPNEGASHVTAYTPAVESWDLRKAASTIYWVDVQWTFPPPAITGGGGETLTTVVTRQTDGTPIEGWIVRYEVADAGSVAGGSGRVSEVRTGPDGRASVQVSPTGGSPASLINTQLIRPANFGGSDAPQLVISSGSTSISWGASQPYMPPVTGQPVPNTPPIQASPGVPIQQAPITPPPSLPATGPGRPRLELNLSGRQQATVGGQAPLRISIRNSGDAPATGITLTDAYQAGLSFPPRPRSEEIKKTINTIAPGQSHEEELPFDVTKGGRMCHTVTVTFAEGSPISQTHCVTGVEAPPQREARLQVDISGPTEAVQGQQAVFQVTVKNIGQTSLVNVTTEEEYPTAIFEPQPTQNAQVISGRIARHIGALEVGQQRQFQTSCRCLQATRATALVRARAETSPSIDPIETNDDHSLEIRPAGPQAAVNPPPTQQAPPATDGPLSVVVSFVNPTVLVNSRVMTTVTVTNKSGVADRNIALRVIFPPNVTPDPLAVQGPPGLPAPQVRGDALVFAPLPTLAPTETAVYLIPASTTQLGIVPVVAQAVSANVPLGDKHEVSLEILSTLGNRR